MKRFFILLAGIMLWSGMQAASVNPEQAKVLATRFMTEKRLQSAAEEHPTYRKAAQAADEQEAAIQTARAAEIETAAVFEAKDGKGMPYIHAVRFPEQGGYVLISGDDRFASVLGYSETGEFDEEVMPENMRELLQGYIDEMRYLESVGYTPSEEAQQNRANKAAISPMVTSHWNQGEPFNNLCPLDNNDKRSVTGCAATAMAQLINYHIQHFGKPTQIIAEIPGYSTSSHNLTVETVPAGTALPDKSLLRDVYDKQSTAAEKEAVAKLMLYCGTSLEMDYTSNSSSAYTALSAKNLIDYFGFDPTATFIYRAHYTYAQWIDRMYEELAAARPIIYSGKAAAGGHAFILDGYDGDGLFHVNWGWGGSDDNYFALSVLNPGDNSQIGASGSSDGYSGDQLAVIGCQIVGATADPKPVRLETTILGVKDSTLYFSAFNETGETHDFDFGIGYMSENGTIKLAGTYWTYSGLAHNKGWNQLEKIVPHNKSFANQEKKVVPISRESGKSTWQATDGSGVNYVVASYDNNGIPSLTVKPIVNLESQGISVPSSKYAEEKQEIRFKVANKGDEFYGNFYVFASKTSEKGNFVTKRGLTLFANETDEFSFEWTPWETGTYTLWISRDKEGGNAMDSTTVTISSDPALEGKTLALVKINFEGIDAETWQIDPQTGVRTVTVYADSVYGKVSIKNLTDETVTVSWLQVLFDKWNGTTYESDQYKRGWQNVEWTAGKTWNFNINRTDLALGNTYRIRVVNKKVSPVQEYDAHYIIRLLSPDDNPAEGNTEVTEEPSGRSIKVLKNGQVLIVRDGKTYNLLGTRVE